MARLQVDLFAPMLEKFLLSADEIADPSWISRHGMGYDLRFRVRPAVFILEASTWAPSDKSASPVVSPQDERIIRAALIRLQGTLVRISILCHPTRMCFPSDSDTFAAIAS